MNDDLISRAWLKKAIENLVAGGAERLKDYYENGSKSEENEWIGGVYDVWELIDNAPPVDIKPKNVAYICDGKKCPEEKASCLKGGPCHHTSDIDHAINFERIECGEKESAKYFELAHKFGGDHETGT